MSREARTPNVRQSLTRLSSSGGLGTPFLGRAITGLSTTAVNITDAISGGFANGITQVIDKISLPAAPQRDGGATALTGFVKLRITDGTTSYGKDLPFIVPADDAESVQMNTGRQFTLSPSGRIALAPGFRLQGLGSFDATTGGANNNQQFLFPHVTGWTTTKPRARQAGLPVASEQVLTFAASSSGITLKANATSIKAETNSLAGRLVRLVYVQTDGTPSVVNQVRTVVSNTVAASGGINYAADIIVDAPFMTGSSTVWVPEAGDLADLIDGDFWIAGATLSGTTRKTLVGGVIGPKSAQYAASGGSHATTYVNTSGLIADIWLGGTITFTGNTTAALAGISRTITVNSTTRLTWATALSEAPADTDTFIITAGAGAKAKCLRIEGWYFTGFNNAAAAASNSVQLFFCGRPAEAHASSTAETGHANRTAMRWYLNKGLTVITDIDPGAPTTASVSKTRGYMQDACDSCEITGPSGYGLSLVASHSNITDTAAVVVWGRWVDADAHYQYQPHGTPMALESSSAVSTVTADSDGYMHNTGLVTTAQAAGDSALADTAKSAQWLTGNLVGAKVSIIDGAGAGQTRTIIANTTTVLTVDKPWDTALSATTNQSKFAISGFGGDRFWFCYDDTSTIAAATVQGFFASDSTAPTAVNVSQPYDVIVEGIRCSGLTNSATAVSVILMNGSASGGTATLGGTLLVTGGLNNTNVNVPIQLSMTDQPFLVTPVSGTGIGAISTGIGIGFTGAFTSCAMTVWGKRVPPAARTLLVNQSPLIQGA